MSTEFRELPLSQGQVAIVDVEDYEWLNRWKWHAQREERTGTFYAVRNSTPGLNGKRTQIRMHREIVRASKGSLVDHKNHNSLDSRRQNLRKVTYLENNQNATKRKDNTSGLKGVTWYKKRGLWMAQIQAAGKHKNLGLYKTREEAHEAYRRAAIDKHGEFAYFDGRAA